MAPIINGHILSVYAQLTHMCKIILVDLRSANIGDFTGQCVLAVHDVSQYFIGCATSEWRPASDHHEENDT